MIDDGEVEDVRVRLLVIEEAWLAENKAKIRDALMVGRIVLLPSWVGETNVTVFDVHHPPTARVRIALRAIFPSITVDAGWLANRFKITSDTDRVLFGLLERA